MTCCVVCREPLIWDMEEIDEDGQRHWDCGEWEPETEEDEKAVDAFVFMIGLEELADEHEEAGDTRLAGRTREALDAVAVRYVDLYTDKTNDK